MPARGHRLTVLLALLALGLGALAWLAATRPIEVSPVADRGAGDAVPLAADAAVRPARPGPLASYAETQRRPLFEPTRRPVAAKPAEPPKPREAPAAPVATHEPPPSTRGLKLLGIVKDGREPYRALIRPGEGQQGQWVSEGSRLGAWRVEAIAEAGVVLEAQGQRVELAMFAEPRPVPKR
jgi:hypothetical protein